MAKIGRPEFITDVIRERLRTAFAIGSTDEEAIAYVNMILKGEKLTERTFYKYLERHPDFAQERADFREHPTLKARKTINDNLDKPAVAQWYLERKKRNEFATRNDITSGDEPLKEVQINLIVPSNADNKPQADRETIPSNPSIKQTRD